jgi:hypothetical protein
MSYYFLRELGIIFMGLGVFLMWSAHPEIGFADWKQWFRDLKFYNLIVLFGLIIFGISFLLR